jgi:hypothetical protein
VARIVQEDGNAVFEGHSLGQRTRYWLAGGRERNCGGVASLRLLSAGNVGIF